MGNPWHSSLLTSTMRYRSFILTLSGVTIFNSSFGFLRQDGATFSSSPCFSLEYPSQTNFLISYFFQSLEVYCNV